MSHYRMRDREPSAIITVAGSEKKIYQDGQIYLKNGENFEIRFFNPLQFKIGVEILFNGIKKNDGILVLNPGEDVTLDRFLGEKKKMKFDTYTIDGNNDAAVKAAALNGLMEFRFYKEKNICDWNYTGTSTGGVSHFTNCGNCGNYTSIIDDGNIGIGTTNPSSTFNCNCITESILESKLETGRVEKGPESNQDLNIVDADFESFAFHTINYQLKPNSHKPIQIQEIRQYCHQCSYRIRKKHWKYCPSCGNKLD